MSTRLRLLNEHNVCKIMSIRRISKKIDFKNTKMPWKRKILKGEKEWNVKGSNESVKKRRQRGQGINLKRNPPQSESDRGGFSL